MGTLVTTATKLTDSCLLIPEPGEQHGSDREKYQPLKQVPAFFRQLDEDNQSYSPCAFEA